MKKNKIVFLAMLISILLPIKAYAFTGSVSINCGKAKPSTEATCTITGKTDTSINKMGYTVDFGGLVTSVDDNKTVTYENSLKKTTYTNTDFEIINAQPGASTAIFSATKTISDFTFDAVKDTFTIGKLTIKIGSEAMKEISVSIGDITFYDTDGNSHKIDKATGTITIDGVGAGLKDLKVSNSVWWLPSFNTYDRGYTMSISSDTFSITTEKINANDKVTIVNAEDTSKALNASSIKFTPKSGGNTMLVIVSVGSTDGYCETGKNGCDNINYKLSISKSSTTTDRTYLIKVVIDGKEVEIKEGEHTYTNIYVKDINKYTVVATVANAKRYIVTTMSGNTETGVYEDTGSGTPYYIMVKDLDCPEETAYMKYAFNLKQSQKTDPPTNPQTGNISIFIITIILVASLIISLDLYRKNIQYYNN